MTVEAPIEFSSFYKILNAIKEGEEADTAALKEILREYRTGENATSHLHQLGQLFIWIGMSKLYEYTNNNDIKAIGAMDRERWQQLAEKNDDELPQFLAKEMSDYVKKNESIKTISQRWGKSKGDVRKHITKMSRYITEGIIDVLE